MFVSVNDLLNVVSFSINVFPFVENLKFILLLFINNKYTETANNNMTMVIII